MWDDEFFRIHAISNTDVQTCGSHPVDICDALTAALSNKTVYSKDPTETLNLLTELFAVVGRQVCEMRLLNLEELFLEALSTSGSANTVSTLGEIKKQVAKENAGYLSGGAFERLYYVEIWKRISLRGNHRK